jgi:hypothetical protein
MHDVAFAFHFGTLHRFALKAVEDVAGRQSDAWRIYSPQLFILFQQEKRVARTMPIRTGARGLELDEGCPTFRRRFLQSLGDRTRARGWEAAMSR